MAQITQNDLVDATQNDGKKRVGLSKYYLECSGSKITLYYVNTEIGHITGLKDHDPQVAMVNKAGIAADYQGGGLGHLLVGAFLAYWGQRGAQYIKLFTTDTSPPGRMQDSSSWWTDLGVSQASKTAMASVWQAMNYPINVPDLLTPREVKDIDYSKRKHIMDLF